MTTTIRERLVHALRACRISASNQDRILNYCFGPASVVDRSTQQNELTWANLRGDVRAALKSVTTNRTKWPAHYAPIYEDYVAVIRQAQADIDSAFHMLIKDPTNPNGPKIPPTLADIRRLADKRIQKTGHGPTCTSAWPTWVEPSVRAALIERFDIAYAKQGGKGNRPRPFVTNELHRQSELQCARFHAFFERQRNNLKVPDQPHNVANTAFGALHLCAIRMAELHVERWEKAARLDPYHGLDNPLPVNWLHLLTPEMRERLRNADKNPDLISLDGITNFYMEGPKDI